MKKNRVGCDQYNEEEVQSNRKLASLERGPFTTREFDLISNAGEPERIISMLKTRARKGDVDALNALTEIYRDGVTNQTGMLVIRRNLRAAETYEQKAADLGDPASMTAVADRLSSDAKVERIGAVPRVSTVLLIASGIVRLLTILLADIRILALSRRRRLVSSRSHGGRRIRVASFGAR